MVLELMIEAAKKAGAYLLTAKGNVKEIEQTRKDEIVTEADLESERMIMDILKSKFPNYNYRAEESDLEQNNSEYTFHIDPLDGTQLFSEGLNQYNVIIGLTKGNEPIAAVIYIPEEDELYTSEKGKGAFCNGKQIKVSDNNELDKQRVSVSSRCPLANDGFLRGWSSGYRYCKIAKGVIDATVTSFSKPKPFEGPAGYLLVTEAGGKVTNYTGKPWAVEVQDVVASNGRVHENVLHELKLKSE